MATIIFSDGTELKGLTRNGDVFTSKEKVDAGIFTPARLEGLTVRYDDEAEGTETPYEETFARMVFRGVKYVAPQEEYFIELTEPAEPSDMERLKGNIEYLAMMTGVEL